MRRGRSCLRVRCEWHGRTSSVPVRASLSRRSGARRWSAQRWAYAQRRRRRGHTDPDARRRHLRTVRPRAGTSFGTSSGIRVDGSPVTSGYLRFNVSVPAGEVVTSARLRLYTASSSRSGFTVHRVARTTWGETTTTYGNAPAIGSQVAASGAYSGQRLCLGGRHAARQPAAASSAWRSRRNVRRAPTTYNSRRGSHRTGPQLVV